MLEIGLCIGAMVTGGIALVVVLGSTKTGQEYVERMNRVKDLEQRRRDGR